MAFIRLFLLLGLVVAWGDDGIGIDPNGAKGGACIDPNGGCYSAAADEGNGFDPHG